MGSTFKARNIELVLLHTLACLLLFWRLCGCRSYGDSGCLDFQKASDLCQDDSAGSGDVETTSGDDRVLKTVCRSERLVTWFHDSLSANLSAFVMVQSCVKHNERSFLTSRCETIPTNTMIKEITELLPVTSVSSNLTYFNNYCFLCSGDVGPEQKWSVNISCSRLTAFHILSSEQEILLAAMNSPHCWLSIQPPPAVSVNACLSDNSHLHSGLKENVVTTELDGIQMLPFSLLLQFREASTATQEHDQRFSGTSACLVSEFQEHITKRCFTLHCESGKKLTKGHCQSIIQNSRGLSYTWSLNLDIFLTEGNNSNDTSTSPRMSECSLMHVTLTAVRDKLLELNSETFIIDGTIVADNTASIPFLHTTLNNESEEHLARGAGFERTNASSSFVSQNGGSPVESTRMLWGRVQLWLEFILTRNSLRDEVELKALGWSRENWSVHCEHLKFMTFVPTLGRRQHVSTTTTSVQRFRKEERLADFAKLWTQLDRMPIPLTPFLLCPLLTFLPEEFVIDSSLSKYSNITLFNVTAVMSEMEFSIDSKQRLKICRDTFVKKFTVRVVKHNPGRVILGDVTLDILEKALSMVLVSTSLTILSLTLITYTCFRSLRSVSGQNAMALCANVIFAQALLEFGVPRAVFQNVCATMGMFVHYSWLAAVLWMNVCAFHVHKAIVNKHSVRLSPPENKCCGYHLLAYVMYAQGVPVVIVGAVAAASVMFSEGRQLGYGGRLCFLSSPMVTGVSFALPLALVNILNTIFLARSVRAVSWPTKPQGRGLNGGTFSDAGKEIYSINGCCIKTESAFAGRRTLYACVLLSLVTGLFWTLKLLADVFEMPILHLLSSAVNFLLCVLISLAFLFRRRVARTCALACCSRCLGTTDSVSISQLPVVADDRDNDTSPTNVNMASVDNVDIQRTRL